MMNKDKTWVRVQQATKRFTTHNGELTALEDINLEIQNGQFVCLLGPSGCGKTTLLRMIGGLDRPTEGEITINGQMVKNPSPKMTMVSQEYSLYPWRTIAENVGLGLEMKNIPEREWKLKVMKELKLVGLENFAECYPYELSGGMRQRAAVARALATDPAVMLMDEPFGALDAQTRNKMQRELLNIWKKTEKTILFVTHSVDEAVYLADKIVILTPHPGTIHKIYEITLPRPRERADVEFAKIQKTILHIIEKLETNNQNL
ncbi:MAG TPA: ABC transporter ATP-binding protein [Methanocorpusculum sp.]|nr:ABC transporter ATP-binding protein [Methanocorpusculum sp.]